MRIVAAVAFGTAVCLGAPAAVRAEPPITRQYSRTVDSNVEAQVGSSTAWTSECVARSITLTVTQMPGNGTVTVRDGPNRVVQNPAVGTAGACVGKDVMGKQITYRSKPGFHGKDVVVYESVSDRGPKVVTTVNIEVR